MKRIFASVGFAALGVSTLHAQYSPGVSAAESTAPRGWTVAATVREFYDDNYTTQPHGLSSYGEEASPSAALNSILNGGNTTLALSYVYDLKHYERTDTTDSSHQFNARVNERFSERYSLQNGESFIVAQAPDVLNGGTDQRVSGANVHNDGSLTFTGALTPSLDLQLSYANDLYAFQQTFGDVYNPNPKALNPSYSALLDRMVQPVTLNLDWKMMDQLTAIIGYTYQNTDFTSPEPIVFDGLPGAESYANPKNIHSNIRNNDSHFFFVGADWQMASQVTGRIRVGGEYLDYYKADSTSVGPYVDASLTWLYMKGSTLQGGITHQHSATDVVGGVSKSGQPVLDAETTSAYLSLSQSIGGSLTANLMGQFQHAVFNGGTVNGQTEDFFVGGLNLAYRFSPNFLAEGGYNWNKLVSDVSERDYTRDIVYLGVRATY